MVPVFAAKSYYGYLGPGADLVDLSASILSVRDGFLPATLNYQTADPDAPVQVSSGTEIENGNFLSIGFSSTGQVTCLAIQIV